MARWIRRAGGGARRGPARCGALGWVLIGVWLAVAGRAVPRPPLAADEDFWTGDSLLAARVDSLGEATVRAETQTILHAAAEVCADTSATVGHDVERWRTAMRWAAILRDPASLPALDAIAETPRRPANAVAHFRLTYYARWAAYRIRAAELSEQARGQLLCESLAAANPWQRIFAEDRLANSGVAGVRALLDCIDRDVLPALAAMDPEPFSEAELAPLARYERIIGMLADAIATPEERALVEEWRGSSDPARRRLAEDVLALLGD